MKLLKSYNYQSIDINIQCKVCLKSQVAALDAVYIKAIHIVSSL